MRKFSRCVLIVILVTLVGAFAGYLYESSTTTSMYKSKTVLRVVPGSENEASVRAVDGGLNDDFEYIFYGQSVLKAAQTAAGTTENLLDYITVNTPANSNIIEIVCLNPDSNTAKKYVDAFAKAAVKTADSFPVKSIKIMSEGTLSDEPIKPDVYRNTAIIAGLSAVVAIVLELLILMGVSAFKPLDDDSDSETEYERRFGKQSESKEEGFLFAKKSETEDVGFDVPDMDIDDYDLDETADELQDDAFDEVAAASEQDSVQAKPSSNKKAKVIGRIRK